MNTKKKKKKNKKSKINLKLIYKIKQNRLNLIFF